MPSPEQASLNDREFFNILLWMPNWIGDVILALPTIQVLRERFTNARITAVAKAPSHQLLVAHPAVDTVFELPSGENEGGFMSHVSFARNLRKYRFDIGVVFPNSFRSGLMLFLSGAENRIGYNTECRGLLFTHPLKATKASKKEYRVNYFFNLLSAFDLKKPIPGYQPFIGRDVDRHMDERLSNVGVDLGDFFVTIHPGGSKLQRTWHAERYGILCQKLIKEYRAKIVLLGTEKDAEMISQIKQFCSPRMIFNLLDLKLPEIAVTMKKSKLFIGNDSGMMHIAAMMGAPIVGIFGPGHPATTGPFIDAKKKALVTKNYPCSPCRQKFFKDCKPSPHNKPFCIEDISVKDVMDAVTKLLGAPSPRDGIKSDDEDFYWKKPKSKGF